MIEKDKQYSYRLHQKFNMLSYKEKQILRNWINGPNY